MNRPHDENFLVELAGLTAAPVASEPAPARLKSRIYSALLARQTAEGPLRSVSATEAAGRELCVFEKSVEITPLPEQVKSLNFCRVCHARVLAEHLRKAPIYWPHCPYAEFHGGSAT